MSEDKKQNPGSNPILLDPDRFVTRDLCKAYHRTVDQKFETTNQKIDGLRNTIVTGLSIATAIISLIVVVMNSLR